MEQLIFIIIFLTAILLLVTNLRKRLAFLKLAQPENRFDKPFERLKHTFKVAIAQSKILREQPAGLLHVCIFWGFLVLLFSASEAVIQGIFSGFSYNFLGLIYSVITILTDIFCLGIVFAIIFSFLRRFVFKVKRLQGDADEKKDATIVLASIFVIVTALLFHNASLSILNEHSWGVYPIGSILAGIIPVESVYTFYKITWWLHILVIFYFMNYLPFSKHFHVYTSIPNVYFSSLTPVNKLKPIDFEKEGVEKFGVVDIEDFTWKNLLDSLTCTHCGRCTDVCPANTTGKILDPREIMVEMRKRLDDKTKKLNTKNKTEEQPSETEKKFIGDYEKIEALWQCTTCGACMQECPVMNEHVPAIVDMRRSLVMMESNFPSLLQTSFANLENNGSPWAFSPAERADWAEGMNIKIAAENPQFDILFWVGCAGSFDDRAKKVTLAFAKIMQAAGVDFAILGSEEMCNGDVARRAGNEYLADMLIKTNIETLNRYNVKKIVTFCPHCFNTFKNEYPLFGAEFEVMHHSQFINELIKTKKLKLKTEEFSVRDIAYHDSCYLGRYNNVYKEPRAVLEAIEGVRILEPKRSGDKGFCCGAGGGQMFLEETEGKRINIERTEELLDLHTKTIALNCPFCLTMVTDGVKAKDLIDNIQVKDISEILLDYVK